MTAQWCASRDCLIGAAAVLGGPAVRVACSGIRADRIATQTGQQHVRFAPPDVAVSKPAQAKCAAISVRVIGRVTLARRPAARGLGCGGAGGRDRWSLGPDRLARSAQEERKQQDRPYRGKDPRREERQHNASHRYSGPTRLRAPSASAKANPPRTTSMSPVPASACPDSNPSKPGPIAAASSSP